MSSFSRAFFTAVLGTGFGLWLTSMAVDGRFDIGLWRAGPWTFQPRIGAPDADPYARATAARFGQVPLGVAEGLTLTARRDSSGRPLTPSCGYEISGSMPVARFWTLTVMSPTGTPRGDAGVRTGFTSSEILRMADGSFRIELATNARAGNWLPLQEGKPFLLMLRLYDTAAGSTLSALDAAAFPRISRLTCAGASP